MKYDIQFFAQLFVQTAKSTAARRSYKHGISAGEGHIPYDTGATQNSVFISRTSENSAVVRFNGSETPYAVYLQYAMNVGRTNKPNMHNGFLQKFAKDDFVNALRRRQFEVKIR